MLNLLPHVNNILLAAAEKLLTLQQLHAQDTPRTELRNWPAKADSAVLLWNATRSLGIYILCPQDGNKFVRMASKFPWLRSRIECGLPRLMPYVTITVHMVNDVLLNLILVSKQNMSSIVQRLLKGRIILQ